MAKKIASFTENDSELIEEIIKFQKEQGLSSFIAAVRILCRNGLHMSDVVKAIK